MQALLRSYVRLEPFNPHFGKPARSFRTGLGLVGWNVGYAAKLRSVGESLAYRPTLVAPPARFQ